jgi:hypothetical protein
MTESAELAAIGSPQDRAAFGIGKFLNRHGYFLLTLFVLGFGVYNLYLSMKPLDFDNVYALHMAARTGFLSMLRGTRFGYLNQPYYRPVADFTIILQYRLFGLVTGSYFFVNLLIWIACALGTYGLVAFRSKSRLSAAVAAAVLLVDPRASEALYWIEERQSSMCVLFGLGALLLAMMPAWRTRPRLRGAAIFILLLASFLSKEYGLAFAGAVLLIGAMWKDRGWRSLIAIAFLAVASYGAIRLLTGNTDYTGYCQTVGFFQQERDVCYSNLDLGGRLQQNAYNVGASIVGTLLPGLFSDIGQIDVRLSQVLVADAPLLLLALFGLAKGPRRSIPLLGLVLMNAILNFVLYRGRNQLVGMLGLYATAGTGLAYLLRAVASPRHSLLRWCVLLALTTILAWQTARATQLMVQSYEHAQHIDPCTYAAVYSVDPDIIHQLKLRYGLEDPRCKNLGPGG